MEERDKTQATEEVPERRIPARGSSEPSSSDRLIVPHLPHSVRRRGRQLNLDALIWALILIWAGAVLLAANLGVLNGWAFETSEIPWGLPFGNQVWSVIFFGVALLVSAEIAVRLLVPAYRRNVLGYVILVIIFASLGVGLAEIMWPMILVAVGVALLLRERRRQ